jgi:hypothetical protein
MRKPVIAIILLFVLFIPNAVFAEEPLRISVSDISQKTNGISVTLEFENNTDHDFSFGWVSKEGYLVMTTDTGSYAVSMTPSRDKVTPGESSFTFFLNDASGNVEELKITGIMPLDGNGLYITNIINREFVDEILEPVIFTADMLSGFGTAEPPDLSQEPPNPQQEPPNPPETLKYTLTVIGGSGGGRYGEGESVNITASIPNNQKFDGWELTSGGGSVTSSKNTQTTFIMPQGNATVTAKLHNIPVSPDLGDILGRILYIIVPLFFVFVITFIISTLTLNGRLKKKGGAVIARTDNETVAALIAAIRKSGILFAWSSSNNDFSHMRSNLNTVLANAYNRAVESPDVSPEIKAELNILLEQKGVIRIKSGKKTGAGYREGIFGKQTLEEDIAFFDMIFMDTSALIHSEANAFWGRVEPLLRAAGKRVVVISTVMGELKNHAEHPNPEKPDTYNAPSAIQKLHELAEKNIIEERERINGIDFGEYSHADEVFKLVFTDLRTNRNVLLVTQDNDLAYDIKRINEGRSDKAKEGNEQKFTEAKKVEIKDGCLRMDYNF